MEFIALMHLLENKRLKTKEPHTCPQASGEATGQAHSSEEEEDRTGDKGNAMQPRAGAPQTSAPDIHPDPKTDVNEAEEPFHTHAERHLHTPHQSGAHRGAQTPHT